MQCAAALDRQRVGEPVGDVLGGTHVRLAGRVVFVFAKLENLERERAVPLGREDALGAARRRPGRCSLQRGARLERAVVAPPGPARRELAHEAVRVSTVSTTRASFPNNLLVRLRFVTGSRAGAPSRTFTRATRAVRASSPSSRPPLIASLDPRPSPASTLLALLRRAHPGRACFAIARLHPASL